MKKKKGFIATSLIYSFFLVFLMLMMTLLAKSVNNRILTNSVKKDIREDIELKSGLINLNIENKTYNVGDSINFANESWLVLENKSSSVVLILNRTLTEQEILLTMGYDKTDNYFGTCNGSSCSLRACLKDKINGEYCYLYTSNTNLYRIPTFYPTESIISETERRNKNYGYTLVGRAVNIWFRNQAGLTLAINNDILIPLNFSDGVLTYTSTNENPYYVRLPSSTEAPRTKTFWASNTYPMHVLNIPNTKQIYIYNYNSNSVSSTSIETSAFVRPVIEAKKISS